MSVSTQDTKRIARRVPEEIATERRFDLVDEVYAEDAVEHAAFGPDVEGREAIREQLEGFIGAFSDFRASVEEEVAEGDLVAMRVTLSGTHDGEFMGIEPTGNTFEIENTVFTRVVDGKVAERWILPDMFGMLTQLGVVEAPFDR